MSYTVVFTPEAEAQLIELYGYIAGEASPETAARFTDAIVTYCENLSTFPVRGTRRDDVRASDVACKPFARSAVGWKSVLRDARIGSYEAMGGYERSYRGGTQELRGFQVSRARFNRDLRIRKFGDFVLSTPRTKAHQAL